MSLIQAANDRMYTRLHLLGKIEKHDAKESENELSHPWIYPVTQTHSDSFLVTKKNNQA
jgi:hypothetical protein